MALVLSLLTPSESLRDLSAARETCSGTPRPVPALPPWTWRLGGCGPGGQAAPEERSRCRSCRPDQSALRASRRGWGGGRVEAAEQDGTGVCQREGAPSRAGGLSRSRLGSETQRLLWAPHTGSLHTAPRKQASPAGLDRAQGKRSKAVRAALAEALAPRGGE